MNHHEIENRMTNEKVLTTIISIVIPAYNRATVIHRAIESIKQQTFHQWECIIVDDCSIDNTMESACNMTKDDKRFCVISNTRKKGAPGARNTGILAAQGEYIVLFDSDNVMHPDFLEKVYKAIKSEQVDICGCFSKVIDEQTNERIGMFNWEGYGHIHTALLKGQSYFDNSSTLIRKQKLFDIGLLDEDCPSYQEWDTHIRLSVVSTYTTVKEELVDYYRGGNDTISKSNARAALGQMYILNKYKKEFKKIALYTYITHNLLIWSWIKAISDKQSSDNLFQKFKQDKSPFFLSALKILYYVRAMKMMIFK